MKLREKIAECYGLSNCCDIVDDTCYLWSSSLWLNWKTTGEEKVSNALIRRIRHISIGWPGSVQDNRAWTNRFFSGNEYLLGHSAFKTSNRFFLF